MQATTNQFRRRISRDRSAKALYTIIEFFDPEESRNLGTRRYRIPAHQRFPSWSEEIKQKLIDTILQDYPLGSIIVTSHVEVTTGGSVQQFFNIQDGQTRLSALHEFANNKFPTRWPLLQKYHRRRARAFQQLSDQLGTHREGRSYY